jgi:hypothetical protein
LADTFGLTLADTVTDTETTFHRENLVTNSGLFKVNMEFSFSIPGLFQTWNPNKPGFEKLNIRSEPGFEKLNTRGLKQTRN